MSFLDHLEELRWHIVRALVVLLVAVGIIFYFIQDLIKYVILGPLRPDFPTNSFFCGLNEAFCFGEIGVRLQATSPSEQFTRAILFAIVGAIVVTFPYLIWEIWRFIKPGLYITEIKKTKGVVGIVSGLFLLGVLFSYFIVLPFTFRFFASFQISDEVENIWRIGDVIMLVVQFSFAGGVLFELPVVSYVLGRLGLISAYFLRSRRKHFIVIALIVAGILTPSPDLISQLLLAIPMLLLYEVSIWVVAREERKRLAELSENSPTSNI